MFQVSYGCALLLNQLWSTAVMKFIYVLPLSANTKQGLSLLLCQTCWRITAFFTPWVWCCASADSAANWKIIKSKMAEADAEALKGDKPYRPLFVMCNHTSFFDTILVVSVIPSKVFWRIRSYMGAHLLKVPVLGTACRCMGHFPVYFKSEKEGSFRVDTERMEEVGKKVDKHIEQGGWLCIFPEGTINKTPDKLLPFRYGGMQKALETDARLCCTITYGNHLMWPKNASMGGFPGRISYSTKVIAPQGCKQFVADLRAKGVADERDMSDAELLAKHCQIIMQEEYDVLKAAPRPSCISLLLSLSMPLALYASLAFVICSRAQLF